MNAGDPVAEIGRLLDAAGVAYVVIGAHAVNAWLEPRFTADIDVTVAMEPEELPRLRDVLLGAGYSLVTSHGADQASGPDFLRFRSQDGVVALELQTAKTPFQIEVIARGISREGSARIATVEDLIVLKLIASRAKDQNDLLGLARLSGIDWPYVERWAEAWDVGPALSALRVSAAR